MKATILSQTFNGRVEWYQDGRYFKVLTGAAGMTIELYKGAVLVLLAPSVKAGFYQRIEFDRIVITNAGAQLVEVLCAPDQGGSDAFTGSFAITSPLLGDNVDNAAPAGAASLVGTIARLEGFDGTNWPRLRADNIGGAGALRITERGYAYGVSFQSTTQLLANTPENILAAASNVNGVIVSRAMLQGGTSNATMTRNALLAKATAPASVVDGDALLNGRLAIHIAASISLTSGELQRAVAVAAGKRLDHVCDQAESSGNSHRVTNYTIL